MSWDGAAAEWWRAEVASDPAYEADVDSLLSDLMAHAPTPVLDAGCGTGRLLEAYDAIGIDASLDLVGDARGVVCAADLRTTLPFADAGFGSAMAVLVLEHLEDLSHVFGELARVVRPDGWLVVVLNHPLYTAPGAGPFIDPDDGEVLWRWGAYLGTGSTVEPADGQGIVFHHRPLGRLLSTAADAGWALERLDERSLDPGDDPLLAVQSEVPRLLGVRWRRAGSARG